MFGDTAWLDLENFNGMERVGWEFLGKNYHLYFSGTLLGAAVADLLWVRVPRAQNVLCLAGGVGFGLLAARA